MDAIRFHFVCHVCRRNAIKAGYISTSNMLANIMTKNLPRDTHRKHIHGLGLVRWDAGVLFLLCPWVFLEGFLQGYEF
jgi:hypothetical protein